MDTKKYIVAAGVVASLLGGVMMVSAQNAAPVAVANMSQKMVVEIGPTGRTLLRGTVTAVGASSLTVKSWGGDWIINIASTTKLMPGSDMTQFQVGDFVGAQGVTSTTAVWTVDATLVRNWTARVTMQDTRKEIKDLMKSMTPRNWQGVVVGDVNADGSFKLKIGEVTYDIKLVTGAKVVNKNYIAISSGAIKLGDTVRVYGPATDTTITASVVRDVSIAP